MDLKRQAQDALARVKGLEYSLAGAKAHKREYSAIDIPQTEADLRLAQQELCEAEARLADLHQSPVTPRTVDNA